MVLSQEILSTHKDDIGVDDGGKPVGDEDGGSLAACTPLHGERSVWRDDDMLMYYYYYYYFSKPRTTGCAAL
jgi:hypothetical protein